MTMPVAILAGGLATRLGELTRNIPKSLLTVAGEPFAFHQLRLLAANGLRQVVFCVGHLGHLIQDQVRDGSSLGVSVEYCFDGDRLLGTGGALRAALPFLSREFMVLYGDSYLDCRYQEVAEAFRASGKSALMTVHRNRNRWDRSNIFFADGLVQAYEKVNPHLGMEHIDFGLSVFRTSVFERYPAATPFDLGEVFRDLIPARDLAGLELQDRFYEIGSPDGLTELDQMLRRKRAEQSPPEPNHVLQ